MAIIVQDTYIEVTRRCNTVCKHCQRGPKENIDLSKEDVDTFLGNFMYIKHLSLGGGEPTLNPDIIEYIVDKIIERRIVVEYFGMVTNGQVFDERIANAFNRIYEYSENLFKWKKTNNGDKNKHVVIGFSTDSFHKPNEEVRELYRKHCPKIFLINHTVSDEDIIKTGFATFGKEFTYTLRTPFYRAVLLNNIPCLHILRSINISANGFINTYADGTYRDHDKYNFGHVSEFSIIQFLINYGIPVDNLYTNKLYIGEFYLSVLKDELYKMGCDKKTIYQLTGYVEDRVSCTPVYKKIKKEI